MGKANDDQPSRLNSGVMRHRRREQGCAGRTGVLMDRAASRPGARRGRRGRSPLSRAKRKRLGQWLRRGMDEYRTSQTTWRATRPSSRDHRRGARPMREVGTRGSQYPERSHEKLMGRECFGSRRDKVVPNSVGTFPLKHSSVERVRCAQSHGACEGW